MRRRPAKKAKTGHAASTDEEFVVVQIVAARVTSSGTEYQVRWKDCGPDEDTWEPSENMLGAQEMVDAFEKDFQRKVDEKAERVRLRKVGPSPFPYPMHHLPCHLSTALVIHRSADCWRRAGAGRG